MTTWDEGAELQAWPNGAVAPPASGDRVAWPSTTVALTSCEMTTVPIVTRDHAVVVLPAYRFASKDGNTWTVAAVADDHLDLG